MYVVFPLYSVHRILCGHIRTYVHYVLVQVCICTGVGVYVYRCVLAQVCSCTGVYLYRCVLVQVWVRTWFLPLEYLRMIGLLPLYCSLTLTHIHTHTRMHAHTHTQTHTHTHTHTHTQGARDEHICLPSSLWRGWSCTPSCLYFSSS